MGQLASLISFYNKSGETAGKEINWEKWEEEIETDGLVDKIRQNYEELMQAEYNRDGAMKEVLESESR